MPICYPFQNNLPRKNAFLYFFHSVLTIEASAMTAARSGSVISDSTVSSHDLCAHWFQHQDHLKRYLIALRPWSFTISFTPVALGSALAYKAIGYFSIPVFIATLITALSVHAAGNLVNTYFDYIHGIDNKASEDRTLVDKILNPEDIQWLGMVFYIIAVAGFSVLCFISSARMEHLALIFFCGLSSSFMYTGGLAFKYMALGDIVIFLTFGPVTVMFSFLSQAGQLSLVTLMYAIPLAFNAMAILHSNNTRDMESDRKVKIATLAIWLGWTRSYILFIVLLFLPYVLFIQGVVHISYSMLFPVLTIPIAFDIERQFRDKNLSQMPSKIAKLNMIMGSLYVLAVICSDATVLPTLI